MPADDADPLDLDLDGPYEHYLKTCAKLGIEPMSHKRVAGLIAEWQEVP